MRLAEAQQTTDTPDSFLVVLSGRIRRFALSLLSQLLADDVLATYRGAADGLAPLDSNSKVPAANLPSYVDDVLEYANYAALPGTGVAGVLYITTSDGKSWRWTGSTYAEIAAAPDYASQAEAEAGTNSTKSMSPLRVKQAIDALTPAAGGNITTPKVLHVTTAGNDTTGDGSAGAPYLTVDKALQVGVASFGSAFALVLGVGSFGSSYANLHNWPEVTLIGQGATATYLTLECNRDVVIKCRGKSLSLSIYGIGTTGYTPSQALPGNVGAGAGIGYTGPHIVVIDGCGTAVDSKGGQGGTGGQGGDANTEGGNGMTGGNGGEGGVGGTITLINSRFDSVTSSPGYAGNGGNGGVGDIAMGGSDGSSGNAGMPGATGVVELLQSHAGAVMCDQLYWGGSNVSDSGQVTNVASDYGGNSNMPFPTF